MKTITSTLAILVFFLSSTISHADNGKLLKGAWSEQACHSLNGEVELSAQTSFKFESNQVLVVNRYFENSNCSGEATYVVDYEGTLQIGENNVLPTGESVTQYTITINTELPKVNTGNPVVILSSIDNCDTRQWSFGDTNDVFSCVFAETQMNIIKEMALVNGTTLYKGLIVTKA
ncbi:hypothetical protein NBRC116188_29740 [Oceaniserpentilla sp. 4NH20-0058]|uniref:hypothetical protein n=1 Tax=Oceaniserpentilla sp. 4NH20-0058 TaxID=3127660 RepID=UPI00310B49ED